LSIAVAGAVGATAWALQPPVVADHALVASDAAPYDAAASSVAADGSVVAFGARGHDGGLVNKGAVYLFADTGAAWTQVQKVTPGVSQAREEFGHAVALRAGMLAVGAPKSDRDGPDAGSAWIFESNGANFVEVVRLSAPVVASASEFGYSVAVSSGVAAVGERRGLDGGVPAGLVHVYRRSGGGWALESSLRHPGVPTAEDEFGFSVAVEGEVVVVGAPGDDGDAVNAGAAFVYERVGTAWSFVARLESPYPEELAEFGRSVAISSNRIVVGAYREDSGETDSGAVHVFERQGGVWSATARIVPSIPEPTSEFGCAVSVSGGDLAIGAQRGTYAGNLAGGASLFRQATPTTWMEVARISSPTSQSSEFAGAAVAISGGRLAMGAPLRSLAHAYQGAAFAVDLGADCDGDMIPDAAELAAGLPDCDANGVPDPCDISNGAPDDNGNGIPDKCEFVPCPADISGNEIVNGADLAILLSEWGAPTSKVGADINSDGLVNGVDLAILLSTWGPCP
jgi:hypothetical protein